MISSEKSLSKAETNPPKIARILKRPESPENVCKLREQVEVKVQNLEKLAGNSQNVSKVIIISLHELR